MFDAPAHPSGLPNFERLHIVGEDKTGKSTVALSCMRWSRVTGHPRTVHVIDTDRAWPRMLGADDTNLRLYPEPEGGAYLWEDYLRAGTQIQQNASPGDFLVVDLLSRSWDQVADYYIRQTGNGDPTTFWLKMEIAARAEKPKPLSLWQYIMKYRIIDYALVSRFYHSWLEPLVFRIPCHVLLISEARQTRSEDWKEERHTDVKDMWEREGVKPGGHWQTGYFVHETALLRADNRGRHYVTVKGRDWGGNKRPEVVGMEYRDFALDVMVRQWGWHL